MRSKNTVYLLIICVCVWFVIKTNTVHGKCTEIIFKIIEFRVMRPFNLTGGYRVFIDDVLPIFSNWPEKIEPECSSRIFISIYLTIWCHSPGLIMNPHQCTSNPVPHNRKNKWSINGNDTLSKLEIVQQ